MRDIHRQEASGNAVEKPAVGRKSGNLSPWLPGPNLEMARGLVGGSRTQSGRERRDEGGAAPLKQDWNLDLPRGGDTGGCLWRRSG